MAIHNNSIGLLLKLFEHYGVRGDALSYGVQDMSANRSQLHTEFYNAGMPIHDGEAGRRGTGAVHQDEFFLTCGYSSIQSLDVFPYEGADIVHSLNDPIPESMHSSYDMVFNGGTMEHAANIIQALQSTSDFLRDDGVVIHGIPISGYINHGYYSISPILLYDFHALHCFSDFKMYVQYTSNDTLYHHEISSPLDIPLRGTGNEVALFFFAARKDKNPDSFITPLQHMDINRLHTLEAYTQSLLGKRVVVWGLGGGYRDQHKPWIDAHASEIEMLGFVNSAPETWGTEHDGYTVHRPADLPGMEPEVIIVATTYRYQVIRLIHKLGCRGCIIV